MTISSLKYDRYSLIINGQRTFIRSGAMHYFRLPSQHLWQDRLYKLKAAGYNTVDLYFNWGFHSDRPGHYDFTGIRDVHRLLEMTQELGLYVIARPGPYINAEVSGGGFPMWLIAQRDIPLRNRSKGKFTWSETYMRYVREWWEQIIPIVNRFPHILMMQIENEYSTLEVEPDYMQALYQMARELGVKVPLSHNDLFIAGLYEDIVDLYAFDNYSVTQFDSNWKTMNGIFSVLDNIETSLRPFCQNRPLIAAELQAGWFGTWKGLSYADITGSLGREHINISTKTVLGQGLTVFNHYKAIGGTNWNHIGSTDTYTSYDFSAPISEVGLNTERLLETKSLNTFLASFDMSATDRTPDLTSLPFTLSDTAPLYVVRQSVGPNGPTNTYWVFLRHLSEQPLTTSLRFSNTQPSCDELTVQLNPHEMLILPIQYPLACGLTLQATTVEPLYQDAVRLVLKANRPVHIRLSSSAPLTIEDNSSLTDNVSVRETDNNYYDIQLDALAPDALASVRFNGGPLKQPLTLYFLGQDKADRFWVYPNNTKLPILAVGPNACLADGRIGVRNPKAPLLSIDEKGDIQVAPPIASPPNPPALPVLSDWHVSNGAPELTHHLLDLLSFKPVSDEGLDLDANAQYEGSAWYRYSLGKLRPRTVSIDATHVWAAFLNGGLVGHGHHLATIHGEEYDNLVTLKIPTDLYQDDENELMIFVDSLGHAKGFHDDYQEPHGLIRLLVDGKDVQDSTLIKHLSFSGGLAYERQWPIHRISTRIGNEILTPIAQTLPQLKLLPQEGKTPVAIVETQFTMPDLRDWECPLGINIAGLGQEMERINIYLNGTLIGRQWRKCGCQNTFYLPPGLLHDRPGATNHLALVCMSFEPYLDLKELQARCDQEQMPVSLTAYDMLYKVALP